MTLVRTSIEQHLPARHFIRGKSGMTVAPQDPSSLRMEEPCTAVFQPFPSPPLERRRRRGFGDTTTSVSAVNRTHVGIPDVSYSSPTPPRAAPAPRASVHTTRIAMRELPCTQIGSTCPVYATQTCPRNWEGAGGGKRGNDLNGTRRGPGCVAH